MADSVYKIVEIVGTSEQSISKAIDNAIIKASGTLRNLGWFAEWRCFVGGGGGGGGAEAFAGEGA